MVTFETRPGSLSFTSKLFTGKECTESFSFCFWWWRHIHVYRQRFLFFSLEVKETEKRKIPVKVWKKAGGKTPLPSSSPSTWEQREKEQDQGIWMNNRPSLSLFRSGLLWSSVFFNDLLGLVRKNEVPCHETAPFFRVKDSLSSRQENHHYHNHQRRRNDGKTKTSSHHRRKEREKNFYKRKRRNQRSNQWLYWTRLLWFRKTRQVYFKSDNEQRQNKVIQVKSQ